MREAAYEVTAITSPEEFFRFECHFKRRSNSHRLRGHFADLFALPAGESPQGRAPGAAPHPAELRLPRPARPRAGGASSSASQRGTALCWTRPQHLHRRSENGCPAAARRQNLALRHSPEKPPGCQRLPERGRRRREAPPHEPGTAAGGAAEGPGLRHRRSQRWRADSPLGACAFRGERGRRAVRGGPGR